MIPRRKLGAGSVVGPYCVIAAGVSLGENCWLQHHVTLCGPLTAGRGNKFYAFCSIGQQTQDLKYRGEPTYLEIGDENCFREFVTINRSTSAPGKRRLEVAEIFSLTRTSAMIARSETRLFFRITAPSPATFRSAITPSSAD